MRAIRGLILTSLVLVSTSIAFVEPQAGTPAAGGAAAAMGAGVRPSGGPGHAAQAARYDDLMERADRLRAEGSYGQAQALYQQAAELELAPAQERWVRFRVADTSWRSQAGTQTADSTIFDRSRQQLEALLSEFEREEDRDQLWAEVQESLADFWWARRDSRNWGQGWQHYQQALDWWAGSPDIALARDRYLNLVWSMVDPPGREQHYYYTYYGNVVPLEILDNVLQIADDADDVARAHYLVAMTLRYQGGTPAALRRVVAEFEAALEQGQSTDWYDDALYHYAAWLASNGRIVETGPGQWHNEPDYERALELYRQILAEYRKGETRYYDDAVNQIRTITQPGITVYVSSFFLPNSEIELYLNWRNLSSVDLKLYRVDLHQSVRFPRSSERGSGQWLQAIDLGTSGTLVKSWSVETGDEGDHRPGQETIRLEEKLPLGAYVVEAKSGDAAGAGSMLASLLPAGVAGMYPQSTETVSRELVLVTDASVVLKTAGQKGLVYFSDTFDGSPIADADVSLWERYYDGNKWVWQQKTASTGDDGLALFQLSASSSSVELYVAAARNDRQAFSTGSSYDYRRGGDEWRVYAFTDRPAYRPNETVSWKFIARRYDGSVYSTPGDETIHYEIFDPRGTKIEEKDIELSAFGSAWGKLDVSATMPLGEYRVSLRTQPGNDYIGDATLFRLEEYKLPEFRVSISTPEEDGRKKAFRLGEQVEVEIAAEYYFGGPVADATVEVLVFQNPFYQWWSPYRAYPWLYSDMDSQPYGYGGGGQVIKREVLTTDPGGRAKLVFDTSANANQDFEYRVEARVTDSSRREIVGGDTVRVTRQRYFVYSRPRHNLYQPQDLVEIDIKALDANQQPMQVTGQVSLSRDTWQEIWIDPQGREVTGAALRTIQQRNPNFPLVDGGMWRLKFRGYEHDELLTRSLETDVEGEVEFSFTPEREGYYRIAWTSTDNGSPITSETMVWVATNASTELGYRHGDLGIVVDKDTFRVGEKAAVMLTAPTNNRYVLFTVEGEDLYDYQLVHLTGTVKLVQLDVAEKHVPNIYLNGTMVTDQQIYMDSQQVVVPPTRNFLEVEVTPDREEYEPGEEGNLSVMVRDHDGNPVAAEISLGLVDESTYYIQQDYAPDPRQYFFGVKRSQQVRTMSSFNQKRYARMVESDDGLLVDERQYELSRLAQAGALSDSERRDYDQLARNEMDVARKSVVGDEGGRFRAIGGAVMEAEEAMYAAPASAPTVAADAALGQGGQAGQPDQPAIQVRSDFRSTAFWQPDVITGRDGRASVSLTYPDSLTSWRANARVVTTTSQFGVATTTTRTKKPLIVRLQAPRFFVVGDRVTISAVINNNTDASMNVQPTLQADGLVIDELQGILAAADRTGEYYANQASPPISIDANSEARVDWTVSVDRAGPVRLAVTARGSDHSDGMERDFIAHDHGIEKLIATSGKVRGDDIRAFLNLPAERRAGSTRFTVQIAPSMAVTMLDALPYLIGYPYGCTEQTLSRFMPAVITARTLADLGLDPDEVLGRVFGGIEQQYVASTQPGGRKNLGELDQMVERGLERLYDFQHSDGGWGWWKDGESDHFMTAYVVWGLTLARDAGIDVRDNVLAQSTRFLQLEMVEQESRHDIQAWMLHAVSTYSASEQRFGRVVSWEIPPSQAFDNLWENRDRLNSYTRALLALSAHHLGLPDQAMTLVRNLENGVKRDDSPDTSIVQKGGSGPRSDGSSSQAVIGTAHWGEDGLYWRWSNGGVEATSFALRALLEIDPGNELIEPVTNWLIKNRRGAQWSNTRDTAITVLALNDYLRVSGELDTELEYELLVNGQSIATQSIGPEDILRAPSQFVIADELIADGDNVIRIVRRSGEGPIYFAAGASFFSLEEPITAAGNEIFVRRQYYKLVGRKTLLKGYTYEKVAVADGDDITSGERVEVVLTIEAKNNYEYLVFEDLKPAGLEAVQIRSGEPIYARELKSGAMETSAPVARIDGSREASDYTNRSRWVYQELRDRKVALFVDKLPEGFWEIRYELRAEVPGEFHALPVIGHAMYVPEIRANGQELRIRVLDRE